MTSGERVSTLVLIHGAWHGSWCWERLIPELEERGQRVIAVDLPIDDPDATFEDYADVVVSAWDDDDAVVVGHSLSGHVLPWIAQRRPVRHLVYLCALVAEPGRSLADQERDGGMLNPVYTEGLERVDGCTQWVDLALARVLLYADCDDDVADAAVARLRPQAFGPSRKPCTLRRLPDVPSTYVVCTDDLLVNPDWSRRVARDRLGAAVVELPGGHSPFYSQPEALAEVLDRLA